jgi:NAD+ synthase
MQRLTKDVIQWIRDYFKDNPEGKAIIGISGGKDSTICAALLVEALGADRVIGVMMPNISQADIADSARVCDILGIQHFVIDIGSAYNALSFQIATELCANYEQPLAEVWNNSMFTTNTPSRLRMTTLYAVAAFYPNSRVVNTSNCSERYIGYCTKGGDTVADFSPLGNLTVREVLRIGDDLGLPYDLVHKTPADGMSGKSDEEKIGFTYEELDNYLLIENKTPSREVLDKITKMHEANRHKLLPMPMFEPNEEEIV